MIDISMNDCTSGSCCVSTDLESCPIVRGTLTWFETRIRNRMIVAGRRLDAEGRVHPGPLPRKDEREPQGALQIPPSFPRISCRDPWRRSIACDSLYGEPHTWSFLAVRSRKSGFRSVEAFPILLQTLPVGSIGIGNGICVMLAHMHPHNLTRLSIHSEKSFVVYDLYRLGIGIDLPVIR